MEKLKTEQMFCLYSSSPKARTRGEFTVLEVEDFQSPKEGNVRKSAMSPYIKAKEVIMQGARKNHHKKPNKLGLFVALVFAVALWRKRSAPALLNYGRENRNIAKSCRVNSR